MTDSILSSPEPDIWERLRQCLHQIAKDGCLAIAYSGGLDSRFLAHASQQFGFRAELLHINGPHVPQEETEYARRWAEAQHLPYREVLFDPLDLPEVASGSRERCYGCKKGLFSALLKQTSLPLCDGTNASDMGHYRPGIRAVQELGIHSPLADAGLTKDMIHHYAARTEMEDWEQKPHPCLLTRLPYGMKPSRDLLYLLETGENGIRKIWTDAGMPEPDFRLRLVSDHLELHFASGNGCCLSPAIKDQMTAYLLQAAPQFSQPCIIRQVEKLSGFFDSTQSVSL